MTERCDYDMEDFAPFDSLYRSHTVGILKTSGEAVAMAVYLQELPTLGRTFRPFRWENSITEEKHRSLPNFNFFGGIKM
jgi:hypothetical protein